MYHALYRKYRPHDFDSVVGQNSIIKTLKNSIINNTFTHAYMFFGPRGTGKTTISKIFARNINCLEPINGISCGKCKNCIVSSDKECVDIIEIDAASNNGVDEIRELKNKISLVPAELKYKVYIIDEVHMLSIGAFNALLKTLEEPPSHAIFILATTDPQKVPETIISRCQCFSFKRISDEMIVDRLKYVCSEEKILINEDVLVEIAISSDGGMRDALGMLDKLSSFTSDKISIDDFAELNGMITRNELNLFCDHIFECNIPKILEKITEFNKNGKNLIQIMTQLMYFLRNLIVDYYISNKKINYSFDMIQDLVISLNENMFDLKKSGNPKLFIEMFFIKFLRNYSSKNSKLVNDVNDSVESINNKNIEKVYNNDVNSVYSDTKSLNNENVMDIQTNNDDLVVESDDESNNFIEENEFVPKILNIDEIINARVNNTLALANKNLLKSELELFELLKDYTFDQEIGYIVCNLLDGKIRAVSMDNIIFSYEYESTVKSNLVDLEKISYIYNKITNSNKKLAFISDSRWESERLKYISSLKGGIQYQVIEEPKECLEEINNNDIITSSAVKLFGDIVEID